MNITETTVDRKAFTESCLYLDDILFTCIGVFMYHYSFFKCGLLCISVAWNSCFFVFRQVLVRDIWVFEKSLFHPGAYWRLCGRIKV